MVQAMVEPSGHNRFSVSIKCPDCGQTGSVAWEEDDGMMPGKKSARVFVDVTTGFHTEHGRTKSGDPIIVCNVCDCIQTD